MLTSRFGKIVGRGERKSGLDKRLVLTDRESMEHPRPIDLPMSTLFGKLPKLSRAVESRRIHLPAFDNSLTAYLPELKTGVLNEAVSRVLQLPAVASKMFLITIGVIGIPVVVFLCFPLYLNATYVSGLLYPRMSGSKPISAVETLKWIC